MLKKDEWVILVTNEKVNRKPFSMGCHSKKKKSIRKQAVGPKTLLKEKAETNVQISIIFVIN